jgi:anhydro-N-acetylmuramic acid kinase
MATLTELTAVAAVQELRRHALGCRELLVCGGGAYNAHLMSRLSALGGHKVSVRSTSEAGLPPDQVEAMAFAWLARAHLRRQPGNLPRVTGAAGPRVLGALYPAA